MFRVIIITPERRAFDGKARFAEFKTVEGAIGTLQNRAPLMAAMAISEIEITDENGKKQLFAIHGGISEFFNNTFTIITDSAERPDEIDVDRVKNALEHAKVELETIESEIRKKEVERKIKHALVRLKISQKD